MVFLFLAHVNTAFCADRPLIFVPDGGEKQSITSQIEYLPDVNGTFSIDQVANGQAGEFKHLDNPTFGHNYPAPVIWIRFTIDLKNYNEAFWYLTQNYEHVGHLTLFYPITPNQFDRLQLTEEAPASQRQFQIHTYLFQVPKPTTSPTTYYMRYVPAGHVLSIDLSWASTKGAIEYVDSNQLIMGLFFGSLLAMLFYNLLLCVYLRDLAYVYYVYYLTAFIITFIFLNGFAPLIVQLSPFYERFFTASSYAAVQGMILFARQFLMLKSSIRWLDIYLRIFQWILFFGGVALFFQSPGNAYHYGYMVLNSIILLVFPFLIFAGLARWYQGYEPARIYSAGWIIFAITIAALALRSLGIIPANIITVFSIQAASVWESILFAIALAYRLRLISEETAKAKNAFLAMVSHELSTPLQRIISALDLMTLKGMDKAVGLKDWTKLESGVQHLEMQMKDLRDYARLGSGKMQINKTLFNPVQIISELSESLNKLAKEKNLEYQEDIQIPNGVINSDALRFQQIINNLCINAIKYTETGHVTLRVLYDEKNPTLIIQVVDSGIGIEAKNIKKILEPFTQVDVSSTRKYGGLGMGLAIVQQLVNLLGGKLYFDSVVGKGTNVEVRIPTEIIEDQHNENSGDEDKKIRVLLVDDTEDVRIDLKQLIENLACYCEVAASGQEALRLTEKQRFDVILLDINMPVMDGFSTAEALRQSRLNKNTPLVWISGNDPKSGTPEQRKMFTHFLEKPIRIEKLDVVLKEITR